MDADMVQADRRRATGAVIGLEQALCAARDLEGLPGTARDDGEVVGGVAASRELPVDYAMRISKASPSRWSGCS